MKIDMTIDSQKVFIDEKKEVLLDVPPRIIDSRTMIPLRFLLETLDLGISWDNSRNTVEITTYTDVNANDKPIYLLSLESYTMPEFSKATQIKYVKWDNDSNRFFIVDSKFDKADKFIKQSIWAFTPKDQRKFDLSNLDIDGMNLEINFGHWLDNKYMVFSQQTANSDERRFYGYDIIGNKFELLNKEQTNRMFDEDLDTKYQKRFEIPIDYVKFGQKVGSEIIKVVTTPDKAKVIGLTGDFRLIIYDVKNDSYEEVSQGVNFDISPSGTFIKYSNMKKDVVNSNFSKENYETFIYNINTKETKKILDKYAVLHFSFDDKYAVVEPQNFTSTITSN